MYKNSIHLSQSRLLGIIEIEREITTQRLQDRSLSPRQSHPLNKRESDVICVQEFP